MIELSKLPIWDQEAALSRVRGRPDRLVRLISRFNAEIHNDLESYRQATVEGDLASAQRSAHTIKGVTAHLGAERLKVIALAAETACIDSNSSELDQLGDALAEELDRLRPLFTSFLEEQSRAQ